jgi:photosystem II stability/assembly factor-like uncharacterized protein
MKKLLLVSIFVLLLMQVNFAQWLWQNSGTTSNLLSVYFIDSNTGWAVGDVGTILRTIDGGSNWIIQTNITTNSLRSVYFTDSDTGWVVGDSGTILKTTDGGNNWVSQSIESTNDLSSVFFTDSFTGWTVGYNGTILKTTDGGNNWVFQYNETFEILRSVYFTDSNTGWVVGGDPNGGGTILKTTDGGNNWIYQNGGGGFLYSVYFTDSNTGWAVGPYLGAIIKTIDGGNNWTYQFFGSPLNSVYFTDSSNGWIVGNGDAILKTTDGGDSWTTQNIGTSSQLNSIHFTSSDTGWAVGDDGIILNTTDGGILPVELLSFTAFTGFNCVKLDWSTATETNNRGFEVQRSEIRGQKSDFYTIGFIRGNGTTTEKHYFSYTDKDINQGNYAYRLKQYDFNGSFNYSDVVKVEFNIPLKFALEQNYPNPFNPSTKIDFTIPQSSFVKLKVYDILGSEVVTLVNEEKPAGSYKVEFKAADIPSGVYFYRMQTQNFSMTKKMILLR